MNEQADPQVIGVFHPGPPPASMTNGTQCTDRHESSIRLGDVHTNTQTLSRVTHSSNIDFNDLSRHLFQILADHIGLFVVRVVGPAASGDECR